MKVKYRLRVWLRRWKSLTPRKRFLLACGLRTDSAQYGFCEAWFWRPRLSVVRAAYAKQIQGINAGHQREMAELKKSLERVVPKLVNVIALVKSHDRLRRRRGPVKK